MAILPFPNIPGLCPTTVRWALVANTQTFTSPLSGSSQSLELPGAKWKADLTFDGLPDDQARPLIAFLVSLRGSSGRFTLHNHGHPKPRGTIAGAPVINGAGQTGNTVLMSGWTGTLLAGDYIGLPIAGAGGATHELKMVVADATGPAAVQIESPIRVSPTAGAPVITASPTSVMRLIDDNQTSHGRGGTPVYSIRMSCIEAFHP